jgi:probable HAF family extracellular repeat protein
MKFGLLSTISWLSLMVAPVAPMQLAAQTQKAHYTVIDLGPPSTPFSQAGAINNIGLVSGVAAVANGAQHAELWFRRSPFDIGIPGLGGPNSAAAGLNEWGEVVGQAESSHSDPNKENFCGYGSSLACLPVLWEHGTAYALPLLGGHNGSAGQINNRGEAVGVAENGVRDLNCPTGARVNGTGPQILDFEAVVWGPRQGEVRSLRPLSGDAVGIANGINDDGQVVGSSGSCANTVIPPFAAGLHAVLWDKDGSAHDLGNLGGKGNPDLLAIGNIANAINSRGQVAGVSAMPGNTTTHAFLWTRERGKMLDLGVLSGDVNSAALGINDRGEMVGASFGAVGPINGNPRAFLWRNAMMTDLNDLIPAISPLHLLTAFGINDAGEIVGFGVTNTGDLHAFLATPCDR